MAKDLDECLEKIGFSATVFTDKHVDKTGAIKAQRKVFEVLVLADGERFQAHDDTITPAQSTSRATQSGFRRQRLSAVPMYRTAP